MDRVASKLEALARTAAQFGRAEGAVDVYRGALDALLAIAGADRGSVLVFQPAGARVEASRGLSSRYVEEVERRIPWSHGQADPAPILLDDLEAASNLGDLGPTLVAEGVRAAAFFPLVTASGTIGKLAAFWDEARVFPPEDMWMMRALAALTAFAADRQRAIDMLGVERGLFVAGPLVVFKWQSRDGWPVEYVSPNVQPVFGYAPDALSRGEPPYASLVHPADVTRVADEVARYAAEGRAWFEQEYRLRRADGAYRWVYDFTVPIRDASGAVTHFHGYLLDDTDRRANAEALNHRQRVESLGVMAGGVAHDFNNLLVGVMGNVSLALRLLPPDSPTARHLVDALAAARSASDLTRSLLAYSGGGRSSPSPAPVDEVVHECVRMLGSVLSSKATISVAIPPGATVLADPTQLRQVVMNLLTNASDALEGRAGAIRVSALETEVTAASPRLAPPGQSLSPGRYLVLRVLDTGVGMDHHAIATLFDPFVTTKGQGRGLGLATVLGIVRSHRGAVDVDSTPGVGSAFNVYLPSLAASAKEPEPSTPAVVAPTRSLRVLVVDDDDHVRTVLQHVLESEGHCATIVDGGERAVTTFAVDPDAWDAVVMDLTMPRMTGLEAVAHLRQLRAGLPVVLVSGFAKEGIPVARDDRHTFVLEKPFTAEDLLDALARVVSSAMPA